MYGYYVLSLLALALWVMTTIIVGTPNQYVITNLENSVLSTYQSCNEVGTFKKKLQAATN